MCLFLESIQLNDGEFKRLNYHQERINKAFGANFPGDRPFNLKESLYSKTFPTEGLYKCRVVYNREICQLEYNLLRRTKFL